MSDLRQRIAAAVEIAAEFDSNHASTAQVDAVAEAQTNAVLAVFTEWLRVRSAALYDDEYNCPGGAVDLAFALAREIAPDVQP